MYREKDRVLADAKKTNLFGSVPIFWNNKMLALPYFLIEYILYILFLPLATRYAKTSESPN